MKTNTQFTVENRRNWKGEVFDYDAIQAYEPNECQYCLTDAQVAVLGGIIETLGWYTRWQSDTQQIDIEWITQFRADIARRLMMSCCGDEIPVQYRYGSGGQLERSDDGGETWSPAPEYDPRVNSTQFPPLSGGDGDDKKCLAAAGAAALVREQVGDSLTDDMSRYMLSQLITDWVGTIIQSSNPFEALVTVISNQIFALVISALRPALTDDVYTSFKCILYCRMSASASFSDAAWSNVRSDITEEISGIAGVFLEHLVYLIGSTGLTNLVRGGGASSGDCDDCPDCPVDACSIDTWLTAQWVDGVYTPIPSMTISRDETSITMQALNRGDGVYFVALTTPQGTTVCQFLSNYVGDPVAITNHLYNEAPNHANYLTMTIDNVGGTCRPITQLFYLANDPFQMKFTIQPDGCP